MSSAKFYEQQGTGIASHNGTIPSPGVNNQRQLNYGLTRNNIVGMYLVSNSVYTPLGTYKIKAKTPAYMAGNVRCIVWDFTNNVPLIVGTSQCSGVVGPAASKSMCTAKQKTLSQSRIRVRLE